MPKYFQKLTWAAATAALCAAMPALAPNTLWAQDSDAATGTDTETPTQTNEADSTLSLGEDASIPQVGEAFTQEVIGDWEMRCIKAPEGEDDPCQMYQLLDDGSGSPVAEVSMFKLPEGGKAVAAAIVVVPLETSLQAQLNIAVDGANARRYPYSFCNQIGCYARIGFTQPEVTAFQRGNVATLTIVPVLAQNQKINLEMSLTGFTAAYKEVSVINP